LEIITNYIGHEDRGMKKTGEWKSGEIILQKSRKGWDCWKKFYIKENTCVMVFYYKLYNEF